MSTHIQFHNIADANMKPTKQKGTIPFRSVQRPQHEHFLHDLSLLAHFFFHHYADRLRLSRHFCYSFKPNRAHSVEMSKANRTKPKPVKPIIILWQRGS